MTLMATATTQLTVTITPAQATTIHLAPFILGLTTGFVVSVLLSIYLRTRIESPKIRRALGITNVIISVIALISAILSGYLYYLNSKPSNTSNWQNIFTPLKFAYAQASSPVVAASGVTTTVQPYLGFILSAILFVLLVVFLCAVAAVLIFKDVPQNRSRRAAANDIVKTFGGFFTG